VLHPLIADSADGGMEGLYSAGPIVMADLEEDSEAGRWRRDWHAAYAERFGEEANIQAQVGYVTSDLMIRAMEAAGPDLTTEKMLAELEKIQNYQDPFGGPTLSFGPDKHQGSDSLYLSQIVDGKWAIVEKNLPY
ncbi:MAG: ABC transporter substrate-binding protein, partial [Woeseiaceae bacterium]